MDLLTAFAAPSLYRASITVGGGQSYEIRFVDRTFRPGRTARVDGRERRTRDCRHDRPRERRACDFGRSAVALATGIRRRQFGAVGRDGLVFDVEPTRTCVRPSEPLGAVAA